MAQNKCVGIKSLSDNITKEILQVIITHAYTTGNHFKHKWIACGLIKLHQSVTLASLNGIGRFCAIIEMSGADLSS